MSMDNLIIEKLIRNISHEIKNPLTTIKGYSQLLGMKKDDWDLVEKTRKMVIANVDLIDNKINSLYRIFELTTGNPAEYELVELLSELVEGISAELRPRVILQSDVVSTNVIVDREHLILIFLCLINGFDWNSNNGTVLTIHIASSDASGHVSIALHFSGVDLGNPDNEYFFLPFQDKKLFVSGTELYESYVRANLNGWEFTLAGNSGKSFYLLII